MKLLLSLILSFVFLMWFFASVIGMVYVSRSAELSWLIPVILGQVFLVIGTAGLIVMLRAKKKGLWIDIVAMLAGAVIVAFPLVYHYGSTQTRDTVSSLVPFLIGGGMLLIGGCGTAAEYLSLKRSALKYATPIEGECVEHRTRPGSGGAVLVSPVYEVILDGERLRLDKQSFSNAATPQIGEKRTLYIDEHDLSSYYEPIRDKRSGVIVYVITVCFMAAGVLTLIMSAVK